MTKLNSTLINDTILLPAVIIFTAWPATATAEAMYYAIDRQPTNPVQKAIFSSLKTVDNC